MAKLTLSLGSNLGNRSQFLADARSELQSTLGPLIYCSAEQNNSAWGNTDQPDFLNQIVVLTTPPPLLSGHHIRQRLHEILDHCQRIETHLGRVRTEHWGPRTIDIDLVFVDDIHYEDERISLPHPWWHRRPFVTDLLPPGFILPARPRSR